MALGIAMADRTPIHAHIRVTGALLTTTIALPQLNINHIVSPSAQPLPVLSMDVWMDGPIEGAEVKARHIPFFRPWGLHTGKFPLHIAAWHLAPPEY